MSDLRIDCAEALAPLLKPARYKGAHGGRAGGKSHFFAELLIARSLSQKLDAVCLREVQKDLRFSVKRLLEQKIQKFNVGASFEVQDRQIRSRLGGTMIFEGMQSHTADSIKSLESFDVGWFEEAHKASDRSLTLLRPTLRKPGSELWFSWNPEQPTDPVDALLRGPVPPPDSTVVQVNYYDNPWLSDEVKAEIEYDRRRDPDRYAHVWEGAYQRNSEARVFKNWRVEEFDVSPEWILRQGADWGFSVDPSVLVQCAIVGRTLYVAYEAYMVGCDIDFLPDLFRTVPDAERWPTVADSARPETISYMRRHGFPKMLPAVKGARSLEEGIEFLKSFDIVVHPRCRHTIQELTLYSYKVDEDTNTVLPILEDKDNHVIDALRYANEGARRARKVVAEKPTTIAPAGPQGWMGA